MMTLDAITGSCRVVILLVLAKREREALKTLRHFDIISA